LDSDAKKETWTPKPFNRNILDSTHHNTSQIREIVTQIVCHYELFEEEAVFETPDVFFCFLWFDGEIEIIYTGESKHVDLLDSEIAENLLARMWNYAIWRRFSDSNRAVFIGKPFAVFRIEPFCIIPKSLSSRIKRQKRPEGLIGEPSMVSR
jgi:hypothetical protein